MMRRQVHPQALAFLAGFAFLAGCATTATGPIGPKDVSQAQAAAALLYVSDPGAGSVAMYSYPALKLQGTLTGIKYPVGLCVDPSTQAVWVVDAGTRKLVEFAHGETTPIRSLKIKAYYPNLNACAVNPKSGDLAVTVMNFGSDPGALMVFKKARGKPARYLDRGFFFYDFVGYDNDGNAFVDGNSSNGKGFALAKLAYGSTKLHTVTPRGLRIRIPGGVQCDGSSLAIGDEARGIIYQTANGSIIGKTTLSAACRVGQFFIDGNVVIAPNKCREKGSVLIYDYPSGGAPIGELNGLKSPTAVAISR